MIVLAYFSWLFSQIEYGVAYVVAFVADVGTAWLEISFTKVDLPAFLVPIEPIILFSHKMSRICLFKIIILKTSWSHFSGQFFIKFSLNLF